MPQSHKFTVDRDPTVACHSMPFDVHRAVLCDKRGFILCSDLHDGEAVDCILDSAF